ncbi:MAG: flagellin [Phycisphaerales bacterium]
MNPLQLGSMRFQNLFRRNADAIATSMERLTTGKRVNRAADDPGAIASIEPMKAQVAEINAKLRGLDDRDAYNGAREGAMSVVSDALVELKGLVVAAGNRDAMSTEERKGLQEAATGILQGIDFLANTTTFKGQQILTGLNTKGLGLSGLLTDANLETGDVEAADAAVTAAIEANARSRGAIGAAIQANDSERNSLLDELESLTGELSRVQDTDFAAETAALIRSRLLQQVGTMLEKSNIDTQSQTVLKLIEGATKVPSGLAS